MTVRSDPQARRSLAMSGRVIEGRHGFPGARRALGGVGGHVGAPHVIKLSARPSVITIALADRHHLIREGVRSLLETKKDFKVVGEVADGLKVVASSSVASREY